MIIGFIGNDILLRGNGKTLAMTYFLYRDHIDGRKVITNYHTSFSEKSQIMAITDRVLTTDLKDVSIGITEVQTVFNSIGTRQQVIKFVDRMVSQTRKRGVDIYWDSQRWMNVHIRLRDQTDIVIQPVKTHTDKSICNKDRCEKEHYIWVICTQPKVNKPLKVLRASSVGRLYDSNEIILEGDE